eukprot:CAMPEP_0202711540 /NCGR_PEP_ID=MMETSP1385-20130828/23322_1 /ASSEMBLY_ACC=CAM_ASM_000861 /TAXON_ID=933848 /ORGANISM="Elphidium margaritaceum" /LENGTH=180 /DNA_ID=CAMNT_0049371293 /DNA_START=167 /DNA_END=709 /DNA_ORIENTATION=-
MFILFGLMICGFVGGYFQLSILVIFLIVTGWCGVRDEQAYNIEQILCCTFFSGYIWVYTVVDLILRVIAYSVDLPVAALIALFGGTIFYAASCIVSKMLYDELRSNYERVEEGSQAPSLMDRFGLNSQRQAQQVPDQEAEEQPLVVHNGNNGRGGRGQPLGQDKQFKAFPPGQGHSLQDL